MNNIYLPLHIWDREVDSRILLAYLEACKGNRAIVGHEYNIDPLYELDQKAVLFRAGGPLDHPIRGRWHKNISDRGGMVITQDEEGINNMPFFIEEDGNGKQAILNLEEIRKVPNKCSPESMKNVAKQLTWGKLHRAFQSHQIINIESRSIGVNRMEARSSVRFDMLGNFGECFQKRVVKSIKDIYEDYILVLDNFSVDNRGQKGLIDPTKDLKQAGYSDQEVDEEIKRQAEKRGKELLARRDFSSLILRLSKENPNINFIFRPHPVLDPTYWLQQFGGQKNISIVEKGPIHAWIYGAVATIHSGCTTGLEAFGADKATYDVSGLISPRSEYIRASLVGQSQESKDNYEEFTNELQNKWRKRYYPAADEKQKVDIDFYGKSDNILENVERAIKVMERNSEIVASRLRKKINLSNGDDIIGDRSALSEILRREEIKGVNCLDEESMHKNIRKIPPNMGKSRYITKQEISKRLEDVRIAFEDYEIKLPQASISHIGINTFSIYL